MLAAFSAALSFKIIYFHGPLLLYFYNAHAILKNMNPDQQGYYQPDQNSGLPPADGQPQAPVPPTAEQPVAPVDPASMQQALNEPAPAAPVATEQQPEEYADEYEEDEGDFEEEAVTWQAQEYIHQEKGAAWYVVFTLLLIISIGVTIWLGQFTFTAVLVVIAVVIIINAKRPPRELTYTLNGEGLMIDSKLHKFSDFKSFGVVHDGKEFSVMLIPTQRFQPGVSVYFPEESGEAIVDMLGSRLPMKELKLDAVDHLVRWLRL